MSRVKIVQAGEATPIADPAAAFPAVQPAPVQATPAPTAPRPSEMLGRSSARKPIPLTLPSGRRVTVRALSALERMMAFKAIGSELITNPGYVNYSLVACSITEINGDPVGMPTSNKTIEALVQRLGDDFDDLTETMRAAFETYESDAFDPALAKN